MKRGDSGEERHLLIPQAGPTSFSQAGSQSEVSLEGLVTCLVSICVWIEPTDCANLP